MLICLLWLTRQGDLLAAPTIHKCVGADGTASYQTFACARPEQQVWSRQVAASAPSARSAPEGLRSDGEAGRADASAAHQPEGTRQRQSPAPSRSKLRYGKHASAGKRRSPASTSQAALIPLDPKGATPACLSARRQREDSLSRVGLKRTYAQLQKLDERVQRACY
jgi:hypothetical protein